MAKVTGTDKNDFIDVFDSETVDALGGDDTIRYGSLTGGFTIRAGSGNDTVRASQDAGLLQISGFVSAPVIETTHATTDTIDMGTGNDILFAGGGNDTLNGGDGYDILNYSEALFASGSGYLNGFNFGSDVIIAPVVLRVDLASGTTTFAGTSVTVKIRSNASGGFAFEHTANGIGAAVQQIGGFEAVFGSRYNDILLGTDRTDLTEIFEKGYYAGNDRFIGRGGTDIASFGAVSIGIEADLANRRADGKYLNANGVYVSDFSDVLIGIEGVYGSSFADILRGDSGDNIFNGRRGDDAARLVPGRRLILEVLEEPFDPTFSK